MHLCCGCIPVGGRWGVPVNTVDAVAIAVVRPHPRAGGRVITQVKPKIKEALLTKSWGHALSLGSLSLSHCAQPVARVRVGAVGRILGVLEWRCGGAKQSARHQRSRQGPRREMERAISQVSQMVFLSRRSCRGSCVRYVVCSRDGKVNERLSGSGDRSKLRLLGGRGGMRRDRLSVRSTR